MDMSELIKVYIYCISAIKRRGYYLFHYMIYCSYYSRAATKLSTNKEVETDWSTM